MDDLVKKQYGKILLKIAGFLEIIVGATAIGMCCYVLGKDKMDVMIGSFLVSKDTLLLIFLILVLAIFQFIAGLIAIIYADSRKMADTCLMFGMILLFLQVLTLNKTERTFFQFIIDAIGLTIPFFYIYGASKNIKEKQRIKKEDNH